MDSFDYLFSFYGLLLGIALGVPAGVYAALHRNRFVDYAVRISSLLGLSFPPFVAAIILLQPKLDENYQKVKAEAFDWGAVRA